MSDMPERIWAWAERTLEAEELGIREGGWEDFDDPDTSRALGSVEYIRADLALDALTLERAAQVASNYEDWAPNWGQDKNLAAAQTAAGEIAAAIRALAPEPAHVTAARVLADLLANADEAHPHLGQALLIAGVMKDAKQTDDLIAALRAIVEAGE